MNLQVHVNAIAGFEQAAVSWGKDHKYAKEIAAYTQGGLRDLRRKHMHNIADLDMTPEAFNEAWEFIAELNNAIDLLGSIAAIRANPVAGSVDSAANREGE